MKLSDEQYTELEEFAPLNYKPEKLAEIIGADPELFLKDYNDPKSKIAKIINTAILKAEGEIELNFLTSAKSSITAAQEWNKKKKQREIEIYKDSLDKATDPEESKFALTKKFKDSLDHYYALQEFVNGNSENAPLPEDLKIYYTRLNTAHELFNNFGNRGKGIRYIINLLRLKYTDISESTAYRYVSESINFFGINLTRDQWRNVQFEKLEKLIALAYKMNDLKAIGAFIKEQNEILLLKQQEQKEIPKELLGKKIFIVSSNPEEFGWERASRKELKQRLKLWAPKLTKPDLQKLMLDADITDAEIIEDESTGNR
jgi:hypothetical protein